MKTKPLIALLQSAYAAEMETVQNYLANAVWIDGLRAQEIVEALEADVLEELGHAQKLAHRMKQLGACPPGSLELARTQEALQPAVDPTDLRHVVGGVIAAEREAIATYHKIIVECGDRDPVTADLAVRIMADEEAHLCLFEGFHRGLGRDTAA